MKLVLRTTEAAAQLAIGEDDLRALLRAGEIMSYTTPGGHYRVPAYALNEYVQRKVLESDTPNGN